ncbi:threonyl-tRNA synthetase, partial [Coemansia sp. Benny D115]
CATIQLDFQLPLRFQLQFRAPTSKTDDGGNNAAAAASGDAELSSDYQRPVIIHRAILGSVERMIGILTESYAGKWPLWLSPRQVAIIPVASAMSEYAQTVQKKLHGAGFFADAILGGEKMNKKIRNAEIAQYNFICIVGAQEQEEQSVNVRCRDDVGTKARDQTISLDSFIQQITAVKDSKSLASKL